tara:strand:- start:636 stop:1463 length:828 start_codon:yes stop_codon:yes gene_type:complete
MSRNKNRVAANAPQIQQVPQMQPETNQTTSPFNFVVPTEIVDIPSKGEYYPPGHPLCGVDSIEIKHLTAKEEDILTSQSLIKKGLAINKVLESIIVDKRIKVDDLLIGDKNALIVASRVYGYGSDYNVNLSCPSCGHDFQTNVDLHEFKPKVIDLGSQIEKTSNNTFVITLPKSEFVLEFRLLTSKDEEMISKESKKGTTGLLKLIIVSINGQSDGFYIDRALQALPILDASILKKIYASVMPDVDMSCQIECPSCGEESKMEVPLTAEFFWPNL